LFPLLFCSLEARAKQLGIKIEIYKGQAIRPTLQILFGENKNPVAPQLPAQRTFSQDIGHRSFPYPAWQHPHLSLAQTQKTIKLYPHSCGGGAFLVAFLVSLEKEKYMKTERQKVSIAKGLSRFIYD